MSLSTGRVLWDKPYSGSVTPTKLTDRSRMGNDGVWTSVTAKQLPSGLWVETFNGTSSEIVVPDAPSLSPLAISLVLWAFPTVAAGARGFDGKAAGCHLTVRHLHGFRPIARCFCWGVCASHFHYRTNPQHLGVHRSDVDRFNDTLLSRWSIGQDDNPCPWCSQRRRLVHWF